MAPQFLPKQHPFGAPPALHATFYPLVQGPYDMLSSPLGQYILDYEPPRGFVIPPLAMYDGSSNLYDHMLHFNQTMILNTGNDRLLCKVFQASLKGPALAWFHKLPRGSLNSFGELWAAFVSQYLCSVRQKGNIRSLQSIFKRTTNPSGTSPGDSDKPSSKLIPIVWMQSYRTSEEALGRLLLSSIPFP